MVGSQIYQLNQSLSVPRSVEESVLDKVALNQAINEAIPTLYKRMVVKLHTLNEWDVDLIAECVGVPKDDILQTIRSQGPRVLAAFREERLIPSTKK